MIPGRVRLFFEMFKSVLKAQNGMNAELQVDIKCGGWLAWDGSPPMIKKRIDNKIYISYQKVESYFHVVYF